MELLQIIIQRGIFNKSPPLLFYLIHGNTKKQPSVIEFEGLLPFFQSETEELEISKSEVSFLAVIPFSFNNARILSNMKPTFQ